MSDFQDLLTLKNCLAITATCMKEVQGLRPLRSNPNI